MGSNLLNLWMHVTVSVTVLAQIFFKDTCNVWYLWLLSQSVSQHLEELSNISSECLMDWYLNNKMKCVHRHTCMHTHAHAHIYTHTLTHTNPSLLWLTILCNSREILYILLTVKKNHLNEENYFVQFCLVGCLCNMTLKICATLWWYLFIYDLE